MKSGAPWTDELAREPAVRRLVRALSLSQRFHFYIVTCKAPVVVDAVLDVVVKETAEARGGEPAIRRIDPYARHDDFTRPMEPTKLIEDVMEDLLRGKSADESAISVLDAALASPDDDRAWEGLFGRMNERRNVIVKALPRELVLFLPPRLDDAFKRAAPDFWSIRSGEYEVNALPPVDSVRTRVSPFEKIVEIDWLEKKGRYEDASWAALEVGNTALRNREGDIALWAFRKTQDIADTLLTEDPNRSEHIELAKRAVLGTGRSLLLTGDVAGAEKAWRGARHEAPRTFEAQERQNRTFKPKPITRSAEPRRPYNVFIAHSHKDELFVQELERHLRVLNRRGVIDTWHEGRISPGENWDHAIEERLQRADLLLLMISADFLASDRADMEIHRALQMAARRETLVLPVLLRPCDYKIVGDLALLQPTPKNGRPISAWRHRDDAWRQVTQDIEQALASLPYRKR